MGGAVEVGCIGCPWYDIQKWKVEIQKKIDRNSLL